MDFGDKLSEKPSLLVFADWYLPGFKAGGPIRSISNLLPHLAADFQTFVVTRDHDISNRAVRFEGVVPGEWNEVAGSRVMYLGSASFAGVFRAFRRAMPAVVYLNSFFSRFTFKLLVLRWLRVLPKVPVVLAPRGEFSPGALALKRHKKNIYKTFMFELGLCEKITWHASAEKEKTEILAVLYRYRRREVVKVTANIIVAHDLLGLDSGHAQPECKKVEKHPGELKLMHISRISPKKNLLFALKLLQNAPGEISFDIYGPIEDQAYWQQCQTVIRELPRQVKVRHLGDVKPNEVFKVFAGYHFFLFPTLGENFGHVIAESVLAGCPVMVSDRTPWDYLQERGAGFVMALEDEAAWMKCIVTAVEMGQEEYGKLQVAVRECAVELAKTDAVIESNIQLFKQVMQQS